MQGSRTLNTFVVLAIAADEALAHAEADEDGSPYDSLLCIIASVFSFEAFLNHMGGRLSPTWEADQESLPIKGKLSFVADATETNLDHNSDEYQLVTRAIKFRDFWAHGKTITVERPFSRRKNMRPIHALKTEWERMCNPRVAGAVKAAVESYIRQLWSAAGYDRDPFSSMANAHGSA